MKTETIRKVLAFHRSDPNHPQSLQKCLGCAWIGFDLDQHVALEVEGALKKAAWITDAKTLGSTPTGTMIKIYACGRWTGRILQVDVDRDWGFLGSPEFLPQNEVPLPAVIIWEPGQ